MDTGNKSTTAPLFAKSMAASQPFNERKLWANIFALVSQGLCLIQRPALRDMAFQYHNLSVVCPPFCLCLRARVAPIKQGTLARGLPSYRLSMSTFVAGVMVAVTPLSSTLLFSED